MLNQEITRNEFATVTCKDCAYSSYIAKSLDGKNDRLGCDLFKGPRGWPTPVMENESCQYARKLVIE